MGKKRPRPQEEEDDHPASQTIPRSRPSKRPRRETPAAPPSSAAVNRIKGKLRDVTRTLERSKNLPADVRIEKERALAGYKLDLENAEHEKRKQQMIKKYHMVRFFERQKATRKLKRLKKSLSNADRGSRDYLDLKDKVHRAQVDLNYTLYYPLSEKYTSIYKRKDGQDSPDVTVADNSTISHGSETHTPKPAMWDVIEQCMADSTLEALREGKLKGILSTQEAGSPPTAKIQNVRSSRKTESKKGATKESIQALLEAQATESDEGFFEE